MEAPGDGLLCGSMNKMRTSKALATFISEDHHNGRLETVEIREIAKIFPTFRSERKRTGTSRGSLQFQKGCYGKYSSI